MNRSVVPKKKKGKGGDPTKSTFEDDTSDEMGDDDVYDTGIYDENGYTAPKPAEEEAEADEAGSSSRRSSRFLRQVERD